MKSLLLKLGSALHPKHSLGPLQSWMVDLLHPLSLKARLMQCHWIKLVRATMKLKSRGIVGVGAGVGVGRGE